MQYLKRFNESFERRRRGSSETSIRKNSLTMNQTIEAYLDQSPAMQDLLALIVDKEPTKPYNVDKNGNITFYRNFGVRIKCDNNQYSYKIKEKTETKIEKLNSLEECLRHIWAYVISRKSIWKISTDYNKEITRKILLDPSKKKFWGEKKTYEQIFKSFTILNNDQMAEARHELNKALNPIGINIGMNYQENGSISPCLFGVKPNTLLNELMKNFVGINYGGKFTEEQIDIINTNVKKPDRTEYYIQPRTPEEAFIQTSLKLSKAYISFDDKLTIVLRNEETSITAPYIKSFIISYTKCIANEVEKFGFQALDDIDNIIYHSVVNSKDSYKILSIIKKISPELWNMISKRDTDKTNTAADMGEMGF